MNNHLPIGVCVLPERASNSARTVNYPNYIFEILDHAGLFHRRLAYEQLRTCLLEVQILITVGEADFDAMLCDDLTRWVEAGGAWISVAGTCGMDHLLGAVPRAPEIKSWAGGARSLGEGYFVALDQSYPAITHVNRPLHLFGGITVVARGGAQVLARVNGKHGHATDRPGMLENTIGAGRTLLITPDVTGTIVRIQQGIGVTRDGIPASDGTGGLDDAVLKADDGAVLDWEFDRDVVPGTGGKFRAMIEPIADIWREILLRSIFYLAQKRGISLPVLWLYPRKLPALAHISHDSDANEPEKAEALLRLLDEVQIKTTWCIILPGYDAATTARIKSAGHELAIHYDALSEETSWSEQDWRRQVQALTAQFGEKAVTNKNHGTRWEGDTEFFDWCVNAGIEVDQTKSPSKTGECGFTFGTCHPYFPVTYRGRVIDCLELCTHIWDMPAWAPIEVIEPLLASVKRHHGVLHHLCHPFHTIKPEVAEAVRLCVRRAREEGMEWWTARQINQWMRARRTVRLEQYSLDDHGTVTVTLRSDKRLPEATLLTLSMNRTALPGDFVAWGFAFDATVESIEADEPLVIRTGSNHSAGSNEK